MSESGERPLESEGWLVSLVGNLLLAILPWPSLFLCLAFYLEPPGIVYQQIPV